MVLRSFALVACACSLLSACGDKRPSPSAEPAPAATVAPSDPTTVSAPTAPPAPAALEPKPYTSSEGRFAVAVPGEVVTKTDAAGQTTWHMHRWTGDDWGYVVRYADLGELTGAPSAETANALLESTEQRLATMAQAKVSGSRVHMLGARFARDFTLEAADALVVETRLVIEGPRLYVAQAMRAASRASDAQRFFDSLVVTARTDAEVTADAAAFITRLGFTRWQSADGGFAVQVPGEPRIDGTSAEWMWIRGGGVLTVRWDELEAAPKAAGRDAIFDAAFEVLKEENGYRFGEQREVKVAGPENVAREADFTFADPDAPADDAKRLPGIVRIALSGQRIYIVDARMVERGNDVAFKHFVASFELLTRP